VPISSNLSIWEKEQFYTKKQKSKHTNNRISFLPFFFFFVDFFVWDQGLTSKLHTCKAGSLGLEPHLQSILKMGFLELFAWDGLEPQSFDHSLPTS
jgi:hypothetical protein